MLLLTEQMAPLKGSFLPKFSSSLSFAGKGCTTFPYRLCLDVTPHDFSICAGAEMFRTATFTVGKGEDIFLSGPTFEPSALIFGLYYRISLHLEK